MTTRLRRLETIAIGFLLVFVISCASDKLQAPEDYLLKDILASASPTGNYDAYILPESNDYGSIPQDPLNPISKEKVELGKMLFFETGLALDPILESSKETYSCSSCHIPEVGFMPGRAQGIADGGTGFGSLGEGRIPNENYEYEEMDVQGARPLNLMNVAFVTNTSWNGQFGANNVNIGTENIWDEEESTEVNHLGFHGLESQNIEGLKLHRMVINKEVTDALGYTPLFDACFPDFTEEHRYSLITGSLAISAYLRTLLANQSPFQNWLKGDSYALTSQQKEGAKLFFGKAGCYNCHNGAALNNANEFFAIGVKNLHENPEAVATDETDRRNFGRGGFTHKEEDMFKYKVPQLYNMKDTPFFFHGSSKTSMMEVVEYFNLAVPENPQVPAEQIAPQFRPLYLTEQEKIELVDFLENGLYDANYQRYVPEFVLSGNCFPNNDTASRVDLGCE